MVTIDHTEKGWCPFSPHFIASRMVISSWILSKSRGKWQTKNTNTKPIQTAAKLSSKIRRLSLQFCTCRSWSLEVEEGVVAAAAMVSTAVAAADSVVSTSGKLSDWLGAAAASAARSLTAVASNDTARISGLRLTFKQLFLEGRWGEKAAGSFSSSSGSGIALLASPFIEWHCSANAKDSCGLRFSLIPRRTRVIKEWDEVLNMLLSRIVEAGAGGKDTKSVSTEPAEWRQVLQQVKNA